MFFLKTINIASISTIFSKNNQKFEHQTGYGIPTKQPYGMHFPNALVPTKGPVHSVPLYEFAFNAILFTFLMIRVRVGSPKPVLNNVGVMFTGLGTLRFCIEYVRTNPIVKWGMTEYQFIALGMVIFGVVRFSIFIFKS